MFSCESERADEDGADGVDNAGVAVAAALELDMPEAAIAEGLKTAAWPARLQRLTTGP